MSDTVVQIADRLAHLIMYQLTRWGFNVRKKQYTENDYVYSGEDSTRYFSFNINIFLFNCINFWRRQVLRQYVLILLFQRR